MSRPAEAVRRRRDGGVRTLPHIGPLTGSQVAGLIRIRDLSYSYPGSDDLALDSVSFEWHTGEALVVTGPAGSGKSTLAKVLKGLLRPGRGTLERVEAGIVTRLEPHALLKMIGWADAQPERQIFAETVEGEVGFGLANLGLRGAALKERVGQALKTLGLSPDNFLERDPFTLSGGEKRRVALASIIAIPTPYYIFDEPEAGLDDDGAEEVAGLLRSLHRGGAGTMVITHEVQGKVTIPERVLYFERGRLTETG